MESLATWLHEEEPDSREDGFPNRYSEKESSQMSKPYTAINAAKDVITGNLKLLDKRDSDARYKICQACPHLVVGHRCGLCGCYMPVKTRLTKATCPDKRW